MALAMIVVLVCFDIADDRIRRRVGNELGRYGDRVQQSVFEIEVEKSSDLKTIEKRLRSLCGEDNDIRIYRLCGSCREKSHNLAGDAVATWPAAVVV